MDLFKARIPKVAQSRNLFLKYISSVHGPYYRNRFLILCDSRTFKFYTSTIESNNPVNRAADCANCRCHNLTI
jgi:hypothetical protein